MKELLKLDSICQSYAQMKKGPVFWLTVYNYNDDDGGGDDDDDDDNDDDDIEPCHCQWYWVTTNLWSWFQQLETSSYPLSEKHW